MARLDGDEPLVDVLPRGARYGGVDVFVERLVIRRQDPESTATGIPLSEDGPVWAYALLTMNNILSVIPLSATGTDVVLRLADGSEAPGIHLYEPPQIPPGESATVIVAFELFDGADLTAAAVVVADAGDTPATIAFDGVQPEFDQRTIISVDTGLRAVGNDGFASDWGFGEATSGTDAEYDDATMIGGQATSDRRAAVGFRWINIPMSVNAADDCGCEGVAVDSSMVTLVVGGSTYVSANTFATFVEPGRFHDVLLSFEVPVGETEATLLIAGESIPIQLP